MKILFVCHRLPYPPKRGGKIRPFNIIKHFSDQGHQVTVGSLARSAEELADGQELRNYCEKLLTGTIGRAAAIAQMVLRLPTPVPSTMGYFYSAELHKLVRAEISRHQYDLVFVHCSSAAQYVDRLSGVPSIMDFGDMDSYKWIEYSSFKPQPLALGYWLEGMKLRRAEKQLAARFDVSTCTTKAELNILRKMGTATTTSWFPNGVDTQFFDQGNGDYNDDEICFIGRMDYYPNQQGITNFCNNVFPAIVKQRPNAKLTIIGADPSAEILALGSRDGISVTGTVDDVRPYVRRAALSVAPLAIAHGTQNKILESMSMGVPVVSSSIAAGGVDAEPERHIFTANDDASFARQVVRILSDKTVRTELSESARRRVITHHNWQTSMKKLDEIVASAFGSNR